MFRLGILVTAAELFLLGHYEKAWQQLPLWLLGAALVASFAPVHSGRVGPGRVLSAICALMILSGVLGLWLHYQNNASFELEMQPSMSGVALFWEALRGAVPALAPGAMIYLGCLGLLFVGISQSTRAAASRSQERL